MSDDALERLKQRQRPVVPVRDTSLTPINLDNLQSKSPDISTSRNLEAQNSAQTIESTPIEPIQTKQSTLRLEAQLSDRMKSVCRENGISREVLLEALFQHYESDPDAWAAILKEAKRKGEHRQLIANYKRAQSMMQRFEK